MSRLTYSMAEAARALGVTRRTLYLEINEGRLDTLKVRNRRLVTPAALEKYLQERQREASEAMA